MLLRNLASRTARRIDRLQCVDGLLEILNLRRKPQHHIVQPLPIHELSGLRLHLSRQIVVLCVISLLRIFRFSDRFFVRREPFPVQFLDAQQPAFKICIERIYAVPPTSIWPACLPF